jgi:hypothetical protein
MSEPYEMFEIWMRANGFEDVLEHEPEDVNLDRLHEAVERYGNE